MMKTMPMLGFAAAVSQPVGYRQRMLVEDLHETGRIALGRRIHSPRRIDARDDNEGTSLDPGFAVPIDMVDHLGDLAWEIGPENRPDFSGTLDRHFGLIHPGQPR
jgi:hypothetical protein